MRKLRFIVLLAVVLSAFFFAVAPASAHTQAVAVASHVAAPLIVATNCNNSNDVFLYTHGFTQNHCYSGAGSLQISVSDVQEISAGSWSGYLDFYDDITGSITYHVLQFCDWNNSVFINATAYYIYISPTKLPGC